jgi:hypothetical protein
MKIGLKRTTFGTHDQSVGAVRCAAGGIIQIIFYKEVMNLNHYFDIYLLLVMCLKYLIILRVKIRLITKN